MTTKTIRSWGRAGHNPRSRQLENDKRSQTLEFLFRLCDALGVSAPTIVRRVHKTRWRQEN